MVEDEDAWWLSRIGHNINAVAVGTSQVSATVDRRLNEFRPRGRALAWHGLTLFGYSQERI